MIAKSRVFFHPLSVLHLRVWCNDFKSAQCFVFLIPLLPLRFLSVFSYFRTIFPFCLTSFSASFGYGWEKNNGGALLNVNGPEYTGWNGLGWDRGLHGVKRLVTFSLSLTTMIILLPLARLYGLKN